jgi:hypothetical protein
MKNDKKLTFHKGFYWPHMKYGQKIGFMSEKDLKKYSGFSRFCFWTLYLKNIRNSSSI